MRSPTQLERFSVVSGYLIKIKSFSTVWIDSALINIYWVLCDYCWCNWRNLYKFSYLARDRRQIFDRRSDSLNIRNKIWWRASNKNMLKVILTHFWSMFPFYTPLKHQKTFSFLVFWGVIRWEYFAKNFWTVTLLKNTLHCWCFSGNSVKSFSVILEGCLWLWKSNCPNLIYIYTYDNLIKSAFCYKVLKWKASIWRGEWLWIWKDLLHHFPFNSFVLLIFWPSFLARGLHAYLLVRQWGRASTH